MTYISRLTVLIFFLGIGCSLLPVKRKTAISLAISPFLAFAKRDSGSGLLSFESIIEIPLYPQQDSIIKH
jgi:hypothetical protein